LRALALDRFLGAERRLIDRARVLLDIVKMSSAWGRRNSAPHDPIPAEAQWRWRGQRSEPRAGLWQPLATGPAIIGRERRLWIQSGGETC
jgi:hypothetical protein